MATIKRISNQEAWQYIPKRIPFKGSNLCGVRVIETGGESYVVFSYLTPIYVYNNDEGRWYGNAQRYSRTTTAHQRLAHPRTDVELVSETKLWQIIKEGVTE